MGNGGVESTIEGVVEEEQVSESYSRISEARINILKEEAEMTIEDQKETLNILQNQSSRLETIKIGLLAVVLLFGLSSGADAATPGLIEWIVSLIWFMITAFIIVTSNVYARNMTNLFKPFILDQSNSNEEYLTGDELVEELLETASNYSNEGLRNLERKANQIIDNKKQIQKLERQLRYSHVVLFFILFALLAFGLPSISLLEIFRLMI